MTFLFLMMLLAAVLEVIGIGLIPVYVSIVADPERILRYEFVQSFFAFWGISTSQGILIGGGVVLFALFVLKNLYLVIFFYVKSRFVYNRNFSIASRMMVAYMKAPYAFHLQRNTAELLRNTSQEVRLFVQQVLKPVIEMAKEVVMIAAIVLFLLIVEPIISLVVITVFASTSGLFLIITQKRMKQYGRKELKIRNDWIKSVNQGLGGIKEIRVLNRESDFIDSFRKIVRKSSHLQTMKNFLSHIPKPIIETSAIAAIMLIAFAMTIQGRSVAAIIPVLTLFAMATVRLMPAIQNITKSQTNIRYNIASVDPLYNDLVQLKNSEKEFTANRIDNNLFAFNHKIDVSDLYYQYAESSEEALNGVSFTIKKGSSVAFTGGSGAGKSTIVDILLGLLEPIKGNVHVDDVSIYQNLSGWQKNIGYIPQHIYLADETMRKNIAFGVSEKEVDDEKVWNAVKLAQLEELVRHLPDGLNTFIGENGTRLSGGQRQRIGIARALYHNPSVLVMDEATSALDNITEKQIINSIESLKRERTIIMVAHRLTTVMNCDTIFFMKNGKIVSIGPYEELLSKDQGFRELAQLP